MRNRISKIFGTTLLAFILVACSSPTTCTQDLRVLFIGNSYTYYNSSPELFKAFVKERNPECQIETKLISGGGFTLARHWQDSNTLETIQTGNWDYVVLQEQSRLGMGITIDNETYFGQTESFFEHVKLLDSEIKKAGAKTVLLMTWSRRDQPEDQEILTHAYTSIAKELNAILAPVGITWSETRDNELLNLYDNDGSHPSAQGSYLLASTLYATLFADNPKGLTSRISGYPLSSAGQPDTIQQVLVELSSEESEIIQDASWKVIKPLRNQTYPEIKKPAPTYSIPVLTKGKDFTIDDIEGTWYGTSSYGFDYLGHVLNIKEENGSAKIELSFYSAHRADQMEIENVDLLNDQWNMDMNDPSRNRQSKIGLTLNEDQLAGLLSSEGSFTMYKNMSFSRNPKHNNIDLSAHVALINTLKDETEKRGFVEAATRHYSRYGQLIGENYQPEEFYLNAMGYNYLKDGLVQKALEQFELAVHYYPESVNVYDSYAEGLLAADRPEDALVVYTKAYKLAKETNYENLDYIEENFNRLKANLKPEISGGGTPPPPPPPAGG